jgi:hypothetical protein
VQPIEDLPNELDQLLRVVKATFGDPKCRPQGKLVLGFRKEWLAEVEAKMIACELSRAKVPLEPLDRKGIIEVVQGPARSVRLVRERFDKSDKPGQRARRILDNRSVDWEGDQEGTPLDEADLKVVEHADKQSPETPT